MKSVGCYRGLDDCFNYLSEEGQKKRKKSLRKFGVLSTVFSVVPWLAVVFSAGFTLPIFLLLGLWDLMIYLLSALIIKRDREYYKDAKDMLEGLSKEIRAKGIDVSKLKLTKVAEIASVQTQRTFENSTSSEYKYTPDKCVTSGNMQTYYYFDDDKKCPQIVLNNASRSNGSTVSSECFILDEEDKKELSPVVSEAIDRVRVRKLNNGKQNK